MRHPRVLSVTNCYRHLVFRPLAAASLLTLGLLVAGCSTAAPTNAPSPEAVAPSASPGNGGGASGGSGGTLPGCDAIGAAMFGMVDTLTLDAATSAAQEAQEEYEQRVCVFRSADGASAIGITIAAIPFLQPELEAYAARPNALADDRLAARSAVLQTFETGDGDDGVLDSQLYLIDTQWSITIQGLAEGSTIAVALPQLTVASAIDSAFAVRELVG
jgi:hypothetical protein